MNKISTPFLAVIFTFCIVNSASSQVVTPTDTTVLPAPPPGALYNNGFDVIIKKNGEIVHGLVIEVGMDLIRYQRTDIPNGPVYTIPRYEVYAISYRNQVKDILDPVYNGAVVRSPAYGSYNLRHPLFLQDGNVRLGFGFIRGFTKVDNANEYSSSIGFPVISIAYDALYRSSVRLGVQLAFGSHKFTNQEYSDYDSTQSDITLNENIFTLHVYGKYSVLNSTSALRPYALLGLGINSSNVKSEYAINFINNPDKVLLINSGARSVGLGLLARIGADYYLNNKLSVFADVGAGPSILNIGVSANVK